jgi:uncharacterized membrane protein
VTHTDEAAKTVLQVFALALALLIVSMILHKGYADISLLAQQHSGDRFWWALARYFIGNLAGG